MITESHPVFEEEFTSLTTISRNTFVGQCKKGQWFLGIVDQTQDLVMIKPLQAIYHTSHQEPE